MSDFRAELINGLKRDMWKFYFIESESPTYIGKFREIFEVHQNIPGRNMIESNAAFQSNLKITEDGQKFEMTSPTHGRRIVSKKDRFTDACAFPRDMIDRGDGAKDAIKNFQRDKMKAWGRAAELKADKFFADVFNKGGFTAGDPHFNGTTTEETDSSGNYVFDGSPLMNLAASARTLKVAPKNGTANTFNNCLGSSGKDFTGTTYDEAYTKMTVANAFTDAGEEDVIVPTHLIHNPTIRNSVAQVLKTITGEPGQVNNGFNAFRDEVIPISWRMIGTTTAWYLFSKIPGAWKAYVDSPLINVKYDEDTGLYKMYYDVRFGHWLGEWKNVVGANSPAS